MKHTTTAAIVTLLLASASAAYAQNVLTPTDVLEAEQFSLTARGQASKGSATLDFASLFNLDADLFQYGIIGELGVGLGMGFELEAALPYLINGEMDAETDIAGMEVEMTQETKGLGDPEFRGIYRLIKEDEQRPQLVLAAIVSPPLGGDEAGQAEITINDIVVQQGEDADAGSGVWHYGGGVAISKRFDKVEPYFAAQYIFGGKREENDIHEDRADVASFMLGSEFHVSQQATLDLRGTLSLIGEDEKEEENGGVSQKVTEEKHLAYGAQAQLYMSLGPRFTLFVGGGLSTMQDHEMDDTGPIDIEDVIMYSGHVGLHIFFGKDVN